MGTAYAVADWIVSENVVVCCNEPDVAVTVTVDVTGCGLVGEGPADEVPPQLVSRARPNMPTANSISWKQRRLFLPKKQSAAASTEPGEP